MNFIARLQNKPRYIRVQVLWISVILTMLIIVLIWLSLLRGILGSETNVSQEKQSIPGLFSALKADISLFARTLKSGVGEIIGDKEKEPEFELEIITPSKLPEL